MSDLQSVQTLTAFIKEGNERTLHALSELRSHLGILVGVEDEWNASRGTIKVDEVAGRLYEPLSVLLKVCRDVLSTISTKKASLTEADRSRAGLALRCGATAGIALQRLHSLLKPSSTRNTVLDIAKLRYQLLTKASECRLVCCNVITILLCVWV